ncbi:FtsX-like permease family protein [Nonomuraea sp. SBT364]|uniref:FtsX-like permease family protein n=1 Tax=Nonomuraea sp. SBT364 TaxID=1580530 RepID=UPI00066B510C|nr:FtsX-like permease family protein [Nonomuraea sp. SBT364]
MKLLHLARVHLGAMAVLLALTLSACLLVAGLPRLTQAAFDDALHEALLKAPAERIDLTTTMTSDSPAQDLGDARQFEKLHGDLRELLPAPLDRLIASAGASTGHSAAKTYGTPVEGSGGKRYINLAWLSDRERRVTWVEGRAPGDPSMTTWHNQHITLFEVGMVREAMTMLGLKVGDTQILGENNYSAIKIVGVFEAKDPADRYWSHNEDIRHLLTHRPAGSLEEELHATALISDTGLSKLSGRDRNLTYSWVLPLRPQAATALDVPDLGPAVMEFERRMKVADGLLPRQILRTGLPELLGVFQAGLATAQTVMYLVLGGLLVVALGVILLAVQLLVDRMDQALGLMRARGGALRQVARLGAGLVALAVVPAALIGYGLSYLFPGPVLPLVHVGPLLVVVVAVAFAAARIAVTHRTPLNERRDDVATARPSAKRITLEVLVVGLALAGAYLLRTRGLTTDVRSEGQDPFLLLVPLALALAAGLITMRCYPYPLRLLVRITARMRPAVPFLGLTRAARARSFSVLPVLILLPALGVSVFASVISGGVADTQRLAAWQSVGAPATIASEIELPPDVIERVRRVPGVTGVVPAQAATVQVGYTPEQAQLLAVDLGRWRELLGGSPITLPSPGTASSGIPALVSSGLSGRGTFEIGWNSRLKVTATGELDALPGFFTEGKFMVVPFDVGQRPVVNTLLVGGNPAMEALREAAPDTVVKTQATALAQIQDDPLTSTVRTTLLVVTIALAVYALVAVVITLVIGAADRARALSFLRTLGLSDRQAQRLTVLEVMPMILVTALVGLALGLGLPAALGPGVDLSAYAGGLPVGDYELDLVTPVALAAGLTVVAVLGAYAHTAISRRRSLGAVLRVGDLS